MAARPNAITVLDAGTGAADIPKALVEWARARETRVHVTAIDIAPDIVEVARARIRGTPEVVVERATLADVAASGRRFDYVIASLFLHHVPADGLRETLLAIDRLAARGVVIGDLVRSPAALVAVGALAGVGGQRNRPARRPLVRSAGLHRAGTGESRRGARTPVPPGAVRGRGPPEPRRREGGNADA